MPVYKLTYFPARGRAELARLLFAAAGKEFEDLRVTFEQWGPLKASAPYGQLPVLSVDSIQINQSGAICRYLAREFGFYGRNNLESTRCDIIIETANDVFNELVWKVWFQSDDGKRSEAEETFKTTTVPKFMDFLSKTLKDNGGQFMVGSELTVADLAIFDLFDKVVANEKYALGEDVFNGYGEIKNFFETIQAIPNIQKYLENRPDFPLKTQ